MIRIRTLGLIAVAGIGLAACTDYGYGGMSVGYGSPGYYDDYYDGYGYYGDYGSPYWGWYGGYYYPGTGYYVYDQYRRPHRWNDAQRNYWERRRSGWRGDRNWRDNWNGWGRDNDGRWQGRDRDNDRRWDGNRDWNRGGDRNWSDAQRQQWQQRRQNATPEQRQQWQQRREQWRQNATPEQRQQWRSSRSESRQSGQSSGGRGHRRGNN